MDTETAKSVLTEIEKSLRKAPDQFQVVNVTVVGTMATGGPGGPGLVATANIGAPMSGGSVVGYSSTASLSGENAVVQRLENESRELGLALADLARDAIKAIGAGEPKSAAQPVLAALGKFGSNVAAAMIAWTIQTWLKVHGKI